MSPEFDLVQNYSSGSLETTVTVTVSKLGVFRIAELVEGTRFGCQGIVLDNRHRERRSGR